MHEFCVIQRALPLLDEVCDSFSLCSALPHRPRDINQAGRWVQCPIVRIEGSGHRRLIISQSCMRMRPLPLLQFGHLGQGFEHLWLIQTTSKNGTGDADISRIAATPPRTWKTPDPHRDVLTTTPAPYIHPQDAFWASRPSRPSPSTSRAPLTKIFQIIDKASSTRPTPPYFGLRYLLGRRAVSMIHHSDTSAYAVADQTTTR